MPYHRAAFMCEISVPPQSYAKSYDAHILRVIWGLSLLKNARVVDERQSVIALDTEVLFAAAFSNSPAICIIKICIKDCIPIKYLKH